MPRLPRLLPEALRLRLRKNSVNFVYWGSGVGETKASHSLFEMNCDKNVILTVDSQAVVQKSFLKSKLFTKIKIWLLLLLVTTH